MSSEKTVLVTGAARGIGQAIVQLLLEKDYRVILLDREANGLESTRSGFDAAGFSRSKIETVTLDLTDAAAIEQVVPQIKSLQGGLFGLINNAGYEILKNITEFPLEEMERMWRINMLAPVLMIRACYPFLQKVSGSVVNISSISDHDYYPGYSIYGGSKAFLHSFSKHAATELGPHGIRINTVSPGGTDTPLMQEMIETGVFSEEQIREGKAMIPMEQRFGRTREVAETVLFALEGPRYLHGADLRIHGGVDKS